MTRHTVQNSILGLLVLLLATASGGFFGLTAHADPIALNPTTRPVGMGPAAVIRLAGEIDDYNRDQLVRRFERARAAGAKTIILEIDTYGGLVTAALDISRFIKNQTDLHVVAFVNSKAISAGALISLACNEIVMAPSATLGDCAPIQVDDHGKVVSMGNTERAKSESPILADFAESAERNGYDRNLVMAMVSADRSVYWIENADGKRRFVDTDEYKLLTDKGEWHAVVGVPSPIDGPASLLTVHTEEAKRFGLAVGTAATADELAAARGWQINARYADGAGEKVLNLLGSTVARVILLIIFINALIVALKTPGGGPPEAIAIVSLGLLVGVPLLTGYAQWWEIGMIVVGIGLIAFEIFVFPGHFVSLLLGVLMVAGGLLLTFVGDVWTIPGAWALGSTQTSLRHGLLTTVGGLLGSLVVLSFVRRLLPKTPMFNRLVLPEVLEAPVGPKVVVPHLVAIEDQWPFVGTIGTTASELKPGGAVLFPFGSDVRVTSVVCETGFVDPGTRVIVREVRGNRVFVRPL